MPRSMFACGAWLFAGGRPAALPDPCTTASGGWVCDVGLPAESSVGGGAIGVVNRLLGIGCFAPRLDA